MGYFQHKHYSIADCGVLKKCKHCAQEIEITSGNQKFCKRTDNPECDDDRYFKKLWDKNKHPLQLLQTV